MSWNSIVGTTGADTLEGTAGRDRINGLDGDDLLYGRDGDDHIDGGPGHDSMWGGAGDDFITGSQTHGETGGDMLMGEEGADTLYLYAIGDTLNGGAGDTLSGGSGDDQIDVVNIPEPVVTILGGAGDDRVTVEGQLGLADGGAGHDWISAEIQVQVDSDLSGLAHGGRMEFSDGSVIENFETGGLSLSVAADSVHLAGGVRFSLFGSGGDDLLVGNAADNVFGGDDGNDTLRGQGGDDTLIGGAGADRLDGGKGRDAYRYIDVSDSTPTAPDLILSVDNHAIDLSFVDANSQQSGKQHFTIVDAFTDQPGQLTVVYSAADDRTHVSGDVNGDGVADMLILIKGDHVDPGEFVL